MGHDLLTPGCSDVPVPPVVGTQNRDAADVPFSLSYRQDLHAGAIIAEAHDARHGAAPDWTAADGGGTADTVSDYYLSRHYPRNHSYHYHLSSVASWHLLVRR